MRKLYAASFQLPKYIRGLMRILTYSDEIYICTRVFIRGNFVKGYRVPCTRYFAAVVNVSDVVSG